MQHQVGGTGPCLDRRRSMVIVAALLAAITIGATACSARSVAAVAPSSTATGATAASPAAPSPPTARSGMLARSTPIRVQITSIGVDSPLMALGLQADGTLQVPTGGFPAGWYTGGPTPGQLGPAIIAGHVDMKGPGVFYKLHDVVPGDQITVTRTDGSRPVFRVTGVKQFGKNKFPTNLVYGNIDHAGLRLITCGGSFNSATGHYEDNLVVFADLLTVPQ